MNSNPTDILSCIKETIALEAEALQNLSDCIDQNYVKAVNLLYKCKGKVVITGIGKSGLIAQKIAATMCSTGTLAVFLHPSEAMHGDLGIVSTGDVLIAIGKSGESDELTALLPLMKRLKTTVISVTGSMESTLARYSDIVLYVPVTREACPFDLAPTASTTAALAVGDALAIALMKLKAFTPEQFAISHPGGKLGKRLLLAVKDVMKPQSVCPVLNSDRSTMEDVLLSLSEYGLGVVLFVNNDNSLYGLITDGDVRRILTTNKNKFFNLTIDQVINKSPLTISPSSRAIDALEFMEKRDRPLNVMPVVESGKFLGIIRIHDLLHLG